jgi:hypothetical protein
LKKLLKYGFCLMTDRCAPPDGAEDGSLHWLVTASGADIIGRWCFGRWTFLQDSMKYTPDDLLDHIRYSRPASPSDATELAEAKRVIINAERQLEAHRKQNEDLKETAGNRIRELEAHVKRLEQETQSNAKRIAELAAALLPFAQVSHSRDVRQHWLTRAGNVLRATPADGGDGHG